MATKQTAEVRFRLYPQSAIPQPSASGVVIADTIAQLLQRDGGDDAGGGEIGAEQSWKNQTEFAHIGTNLRYIHIADGNVREGARAAGGDGIGGFCLRPRERFVNCVLPTHDNKRDPNDDTGGLKTLVFRAKKGDSWVCVLDDRRPLRTRLFHARQTPNQDVSIETEQPLPSDWQGRIDLAALQVAFGQTQKARIRIALGKQSLSLVIRQDNYPTLERRSHSGQGGWEILQKLEAFGKTTMEGDLIVHFEQIDGRTVIGLQQGSAPNQGIAYLNSQPIFGVPPLRYVPVDAHWPSGKMSVTLYGISAHIGVAFLETQDDKGAPLKDFYERIIHQDYFHPSPQDTFTGGTAGWAKRGTKTRIEIEPVYSATGTTTTGAIKYRCHLEADLEGRFSPFVSNVLGHVEGEPVPKIEAQGWDVSEAVETYEWESAEPGTMAGSELSLDISRTVLEMLPLPNDAPPGSGWEDVYLIDDGYNPCDFSLRWRRDDGSYTDWVGVRAYVWNIAKGSTGFGDDTMRLTLRDSIARYQGSSGIVGEKFPILDLTFLQQFGAPVYFADLQKKIIEYHMGLDEAEKINGNGDARRFIVPDQPPAMSQGTDRMGYYDVSPPQTESGFYFTPPWFQKDVLSWMKDLAEADGAQQSIAILLYGYVDSIGTGDEWQVPIYGMLDQFLAWRQSQLQALTGRGYWIIPDARYRSGDEELLLQSANVETRPDQDFNTWVVAHNLAGDSELRRIQPAGQIAESRLPPDHPRAPEKTWPRTSVTELTQDFLRDGAGNHIQSIASLLAADNSGSSVRHPRLSFRGEERMQWGDIAWVKQAKQMGIDGDDESDTKLNLNEWFRVLRVKHRGEAAQHEFQTDAVLFPLSELEKEALGLPATPPEVENG